MRFQAIHIERKQYSVVWMCGLLKVSSSGFYAWRSKKEKKKASRDAALSLSIKSEYSSSRGAYGSPRVHRALRAIGIRVSCKRVARIMRDFGLVGRTRRRFIRTTIRDKKAVPSQNILDRMFSSSEVNQKWVTDITFLPTQEGWVYLASIIDLFSRRVVGYALADNMRVEMALQALENAVKARKPSSGLLHHSDQGSQLRFNGSSQQLSVDVHIQHSRRLRQGFSIRDSCVVGY